MEKIIIVEDNEDIRGQLTWGLGKDYDVFSAENRQEALSLFKKHSPKVVALDLGLPPDEDGSEEGFSCLDEILQMAPLTRVIMITGNNDRENAFRAMQSGASDYYYKPIDISELKIILRRAFHLAHIDKEIESKRGCIRQHCDNLDEIVSESPRMMSIFSLIRKVATTDVAALITGESGTGKELVAKAIHRLSSRKNGPFIAINCGAIPENLLESELFGHEKGAFSGAHTRLQGKVEYAHKGTLFLDEIGELPLNLQVKLLRFLQEKKIQRVGGREDINIDARIVAATNRDIAMGTEAGAFREDLYYRISGININLPPLRERGNDIILLSNLFLRRYCLEFKKKTRRFSPEAILQLKNYNWPGNVRELENKVRRAVIMSDTVQLEPEALGLSNRITAGRMSDKSGMTLRDAREKLEHEMILTTIENQQNNMSKAADVLGVSRPTLYDLVKKHGITKNLIK